MARPNDIVEQGGMPEWLQKVASPTLIPGLRYAIQRDPIYPSRTELLDRFEAIEQAAQLLMRELPNLHIQALLLEGDTWITNEIEMYHGLKDLAARATRVCARIPRRQGRGSLYPETAKGPNPMDHCALIYEVVHHREFGIWPKNDANARQACEALWRAAGGPQRVGQGNLPHSSSTAANAKRSEAASNWGKLGSDTVAVWKRHLTAAKKYRPPHPAGAFIQRILSRGDGT